MSKKNINLKTLGLIGSIVLLLITLFLFWNLWLKTQVEATVNYFIDPKYKAVEIESVKKEAEELIKDRSNISGMPIGAPTETEIGRENPFLSVE